MENHFNKENEFLRFLSGMYSPLTCSMILKKLIGQIMTDMGFDKIGNLTYGIVSYGGEKAR